MCFGVDLFYLFCAGFTFLQSDKISVLKLLGYYLPIFSHSHLLPPSPLSLISYMLGLLIPFFMSFSLSVTFSVSVSLFYILSYLLIPSFRFGNSLFSSV